MVFQQSETQCLTGFFTKIPWVSLKPNGTGAIKKSKPFKQLGFNWWTFPKIDRESGEFGKRFHFLKNHVKNNTDIVLVFWSF